MGLFKGLQMAWDHDIHLLHVEVDNLGITEILTASSARHNAISSLFWASKTC